MVKQTLPLMLWTRVDRVVAVEGRRRHRAVATVVVGEAVRTLRVKLVIGAVLVTIEKSSAPPPV
jgi:hypothetical protein